MQGSYAMHTSVRSCKSLVAGHVMRIVRKYSPLLSFNVVVACSVNEPHSRALIQGCIK